MARGRRAHPVVLAVLAVSSLLSTGVSAQEVLPIPADGAHGALRGAAPSGAAERRLQEAFGGSLEEPVLTETEEQVQGDSLSALSSNSMQIIGSMVMAFLQKQEIDPEAKACLVQGSEKFTANIMTVASHIVMLIQQVMGKRKDMPGLDSQLFKPGALLDLTLETGDEGTSQPEAEATLREATTANVPSEAPAADHDALGRRLLDVDQVAGGAGLLMHMSAVFLELGYSIQLLAKLSKHVADECITGEALEAMQLAAQHARDFKYIGGHFLANGADVVTEMAQAAEDYQSKNFTSFGTNIGTALRKILLSNNPNATLPTGVTGRHMLVNMSMGFVKGFFGKGFALGIRLDQDPNGPLRVDLEECIANNLVFFEEIWSAFAYAYVQKHTPDSKEGDQQEGADQQSKGRMQVGTALAVAALQFPDALRRCGIGEEQVDMLMDSAKAFGEGMHLTLSTPNKMASRERITKDVGKAIQDWSKLDWYVFGRDVGKLLREMALQLFPKKYSVDAAGSLRHRLSQMSSASMGVAAGHLAGLRRLPTAVVLSALVLLLAAAGLPATLRMERWRRSRGAEAVRILGPDVLE